MDAKLIALDASNEMEAIQLDQLPVEIGRHQDAELTIDDRWVSRRHCRIEFIDGTLWVRDLDSKHGTFVNNEQIAEAPLLPGDRLGVGMSSFVVSYQRPETVPNVSLSQAKPR